MTAKEAIEAIKVMKGFVEWELPLDTQMACDIAIEALEKQIPKRPKKEISYCDYIFDYFCPNCDCFITNTYEEEYVEYCDECGQKIDWSEE